MPDPITIGVAAWLAKEVVAPDLFTRGVDALRNPSDAKRLEKAVREDTGIPPRSGFRRWYESDATWVHLVERTQASFDALVHSLAIERQGRIRHRSLDLDQAQALVESAITNFMASLDPSMAIAVSDYRQGKKLDALQASVDADKDFETNLSRVPPVPRSILAGSSSPLARRLAAIAAGADPRSALGALLVAVPPWLEEAPPEVLLAAAALAQAHGLRGAAGQMFEAAGEAGLERSTNLARAAFDYAMGGDRDEAQRVLATAEMVDPDSWWLGVVRSHLAEDWPGVIGAVAEGEVVVDPLMAQIYASAAQMQGDNALALRVLEVALEAHPESASISTNLANVLLQRAANAATPTRTADRTRALSLARSARDMRRAWRVASVESVRTAMTACITLGDFRTVLALGTVVPKGEATEAEAADHEVRQMMVQALLVLGRVEEATDLTAQVTDGFTALLLQADALAQGGVPVEAVSHAYGTAWTAATDDHQRFSVWLGAAQAGVEPLPGADELAGRTDEPADLVRAQVLLRQSRPQEAVDLLRQRRDSEPCSRLLVHAYVDLERPDLARAELERAADRFDNPLLLRDAVQMLLIERDLDSAAEVAAAALAKIPRSLGDARDLLHQVLVAAAGERGEWHDLERRARAWIEERGPDPSRRWLLVQALHNQGEMAKAWAVMNDHPALDPSTPVEAQLWMTLHAAERPTAELPMEMRRLIEHFNQNPDVIRAATNAYLHLGNRVGELPQAEIDAWQSIFAARATNAETSDDVFTTISLPDDPEDLSEALRPLLEPTAERVDQLHTMAKKGAPLGLLAALAGRSYAAILTHRGLGWLPIAELDHAKHLVEVEVVERALGETVVVDTSTLAVGFHLADLWPDLHASFARLTIGSPARHDISTEVANLVMRPSGWLSWDSQAGMPVMQEASPEDLVRIERHTNWLGTVSAHLEVHDLGALTLPDLDDTSDPRMLTWLGQVDLARRSGLPLWADDLGLRRIAEQFGVATFGTYALLDVLSRQQPEGWLDAARERLLDEYCVDLPCDRGWLTGSATRHEWTGGPAAANLARGAVWADPISTLRAWDDIVAAAAATDPALVSRWLFAACCGISQRFDRQVASDLAAGLACKAVAIAGLKPDLLAEYLNSARAACVEFDLPDPGLSVLQRLHGSFVEHLGPEHGARLLVELADGLDGSDRESLREVVWSARPSREATPEG